MPILYVLAIFGCMVGSIFALLIAAYSVARGYWIAAGVAAIVGILAFTAIGGFAHKIEASYHAAIEHGARQQ